LSVGLNFVQFPADLEIAIHDYLAFTQVFRARNGDPENIRLHSVLLYDRSLQRPY
jgi:hypothetical protein